MLRMCQNLKHITGNTLPTHLFFCQPLLFHIHFQDFPSKTRKPIITSRPQIRESVFTQQTSGHGMYFCHECTKLDEVGTPKNTNLHQGDVLRSDLFCLSWC